MAAGQGRTSAVLAVAGRVWAPDFYRVAGRTGPRNTMRLGAITAGQTEAQHSAGGRWTGSFFTSYILTTYARGGVLISPLSESFKVPIPQEMRHLFPVAELQPAGAQPRAGT